MFGIVLEGKNNSVLKPKKYGIKFYHKLGISHSKGTQHFEILHFDTIIASKLNQVCISMLQIIILFYLFLAVESKHI